MDRRDRAWTYRFRKPIRVFLLILLIVFSLSAFYALSLFGPQKVDPDGFSEKADTGESAELLGKSEDFEQQFLEIAGLRTATEEDVALLVQAIAFQKNYIESTGGFNRDGSARLKKLETLYQNEVARGVLEESLEAEREAMRYEDTKTPLKALKPYRLALKLQEKIDQDYPLSKAKNLPRSLRLQRSVKNLMALPIYEETIEAAEAAEAALERKDWKQAKVHYETAIKAQKKLNMNFRGLQYANVGRLSRLETDLDSLESSDLFSAIESFTEQGMAKEAEGNYREAAEFYQQAARKQADLNRDFPQSRFSSTAKVDEFEEATERALSQDLGQDILREVKALDEHIKGRSNWQAVEAINGLFQKAERFKESFPRSPLLGDELLLKLQYLNFVQGDLAHLQDRIYAQLIPLPGDSTVHLLKTEVSQALYSSIMLTNPSRQRGERRPVDSVTWSEANEFCMKISWILGRPVRLPKKEEFRTAVGSLRYVKLDDIAWFVENSENRSHKIGEKALNKQGYFDLLGNVAEWLDSAEFSGGGEAYLAGGSAEDSIDKLADVPVEIVNSRSRNRMSGFRFVVLFSDE